MDMGTGAPRPSGTEAPRHTTTATNAPRTFILLQPAKTSCTSSSRQTCFGNQSAHLPPFMHPSNAVPPPCTREVEELLIDRTLQGRADAFGELVQPYLTP